MKTHLSVIIVNWNTKELLKQCISSVYSESKKYNIEVIVADNNSADGSADMVLREFPYVRLIRNLENFGFLRAWQIFGYIAVHQLGLAEEEFPFYTDEWSEVSQKVILKDILLYLRLIYDVNIFI